MQVSDFLEVCEKCEATGDDFQSCEYWLHETEYYGSSVHVRNYCKDHITGFELYDGRKEFVCDKCMRYVNLFRKCADIREIIWHVKIRCGGSMKDFIECYDKDKNLPRDVEKFFMFLNFWEYHEDKAMRDLENIDLQIVRNWVLVQNY